MEIVFVTNYPNHYQISLADAMKAQGIRYWILAVDEVPEDRIRGGFSKEFDKRRDVINVRKDPKTADFVIEHADLVIVSYIGIPLVRERIRQGGMTFIESERIFKSTGSRTLAKGKNFLRRIRYSMLIRWLREYCYFLLIGPYAISDHIVCGVPKSRIMRFAYFPPLSNHSEPKEYFCAGHVRMLWVGRNLAWKHPEMAVCLADRLIREGYAVSLTVIGEGFEDKKQGDGGRSIEYKRALPFRQIREEMFTSDVFLFTSDHAEGWGCVLNEAMSEGCVPIASIQAGATPYLVDHERNGWIYDGSEEGLYQAAIKMLRTPKDELCRMGEAARSMIEETWNASNAVQNLVKQVNEIKNRQSPSRMSGPCGIAETE